MNTAGSVALRVERHDGSYAFDDDAVPSELSIERFTQLAAPRLRYPVRDIASDKPITYALLDGAREVPKDSTVGREFPQRGAKVRVVHEFRNA